MLQPVTIDQHARGERMRAVSQPIGKGGAAAGGGKLGVVFGDWIFPQRHHPKVGGFHGVLGLIVIATVEHVRHRHLARLLGKRADEGLLRLGGTDVLGLFVHGIEHLFTEVLLKIIRAISQPFQFLGAFAVKFFQRLFIHQHAFMFGEQFLLLLSALFGIDLDGSLKLGANGFRCGSEGLLAGAFQKPGQLLFALGIEFADLSAVFTVIKVEGATTDLAHARIFFQERLLLVSTFG